jgi:outer membrane protein
MQPIHRFLALLTIAAAIGIHAQPASKRTLTLEECIQMALLHNLDLQIQRYVPEIARFNLSGAYAAYDPTFNGLVRQSFSASESGFNPNAFNPPSNETWLEQYEAGVGGTAPTGLRYDLFGNVDRSSGEVAAGNPPVLTDVGFDYRTRVGINLTQPLLKNFWIDAPRLQIALSKRNLKISELSLRQLVMTTVTSVETVYYNLIFAQENVKVQEKALELAERLLAENKKRVEVGALAPLDEKQAQSEVAARKADLLTAQRDLQTQQNTLKSLLTDDYSSWHPVYIDPAAGLTAPSYAVQLQDSWEKGLTLRPDLLQSRLTLEMQNIQLKYDRNQLFPQLDLLGSFGYTGRDTDINPALGDIGSQRNPNHSAGIQLTIPFSNRAARNSYKASKARKEQAILNLKKLEQSIMVQIDENVGQVKTSFERVDATKQARMFAEEALDAEEKKLANGKSTSFEVLRLQRDLTAARSAEIRALADYNVALANLAASEGTTLERNRIDMEVK